MKKIIALLLSLTMMLGLSVPAFAANENSGSMYVGYNVDCSYLINIPDIICNSTNETFDITAEYVHLSNSRYLIVSVDADKTLTDGCFYLENQTSGNKETMLCDICVSNSDGASTPSSYNISETNTRLALFADGDTQARDYGRISLSLYVNSSTPTGYYSGDIYYIITIE